MKCEMLLNVEKGAAGDDSGPEKQQNNQLKNCLKELITL
jgi:hypothetical protein